MFRLKKFSFLTDKDDRVKIMNERINITERHIVDLYTNIASISRKIARTRDKYDEFAKTLKNYSDEEPISETLAEGMKTFANATTFLADYMDLEVHRLDSKIINEHTQYENLCRTTRDKLRTITVQRDKETFRHNQLLDLKNRFSSSNAQSADTELLKVKMEVTRVNKEIDDIIENFEKQKNHDLKTLMLNFTLIQMKMHTKAIEVLTGAYYDIENIDEDKDLLDFQKIFRSKEKVNPKGSIKKVLRPAQSMENLGSGGLSHFKVDRSKSAKNRLSRSNKDISKVQSDEELDDEEEEDDEEDEDEESIPESTPVKRPNRRQPSRIPEESNDEVSDEDFKKSSKGNSVRMVTVRKANKDKDASSGSKKSKQSKKKVIDCTKKSL